MMKISGGTIAAGVVAAAAFSFTGGFYKGVETQSATDRTTLTQAQEQTQKSNTAIGNELALSCWERSVLEARIAALYKTAGIPQNTPWSSRDASILTQILKAAKQGDTMRSFTDYRELAFQQADEGAYPGIANRREFEDRVRPIFERKVKSLLGQRPNGPMPTLPGK